jgi:hypothetical protein
VDIYQCGEEGGMEGGGFDNHYSRDFSEGERIVFIVVDERKSPSNKNTSTKISVLQQ